jgi:beta-carotene ketolase (CrtW type)
MLPFSGMFLLRRYTLMNWSGVLIAVTVIGLWGLSISSALLSTETSLFFILWLTFLYTGLFITAHDAMHGTVCPQSKMINNLLGTLCVWLYALFSFKRLLREHKLHHLSPGTSEDPDFHDSHSSGFFAWYFQFLRHYITWKQLLGMALMYNFLTHFVGLTDYNVLLFWVTPSLLSTLQLFYFGTYLPHREEDRSFIDHHRARSQRWPWLVSFFTCYHFGYHLEHHRSPATPWWRLPSVLLND